MATAPRLYIASFLNAPLRDGPIGLQDDPK
jgi:hypothetical protein